MNRPTEIPLQKLRQCLSYCPETGILRWTKTKKGRKSSGIAGTWQTRYMVVYVDGIRLKYHRIAWALAHGRWPTGVVDHINGNTKDNRLSNLRDVSHEINMQNQRCARADNKSRLLGVAKTNRGKWRARLRTKNKAHYGPSREDPQKAHLDYLLLKRKLHAGCSI